MMNTKCHFGAAVDGKLFFWFLTYVTKSQNVLLYVLGKERLC